MKAFKVGVVAALAMAFGFAALQCGPARAQQRLGNAEWLRRASPTEQRATAHQALTFLLGDPHDALAVLERHGDESSIPYLEAALARQPAEQVASVECTWAHGRHALERARRLLRATGP